MSLPEILEAVKGLPQVEKIQLMHALVDEFGGTRDSPSDDAALAFPPAAVLHMGWRAEIVSPIVAPEAAAALAALLAEDSRP